MFKGIERHGLCEGVVDNIVGQRDDRLSVYVRAEVVVSILTSLSTCLGGQASTSNSRE
jgi:hypothetical protein